MKSEELNAESLRRFQVAQVKLAGWLIEWIESQREKLKEKKKISVLLSILHRIVDLRAQVVSEYFHVREQPLTKVRPLKALPLLQATKTMVKAYGNIRIDLSGYFYREDSKMPYLPSISHKPATPESNLVELNICFGQLLGHVLGRIYEFVI